MKSTLKVKDELDTGIFATSDGETFAISKERLDSLLKTEERTKTMASDLAHRSAAVRGTKMRLVNAIILSQSMRGKNTREILDELSARGFERTPAYIPTALSVKRESDYWRLKGLMDEYPDEFVGLGEKDFIEWYERMFGRAHERALKRRDAALAAADDFNKTDLIRPTADEMLTRKDSV